MTVQKGDGGAAVPKKAITLSTEGARFIEAWEGFRSAPYNDSRGFATIGVGRLLHYSNVNAGDLTAGRTIIPGVVTGKGGTITLAQALLLEEHDAETNALVPLRASLQVAIDEAQIVALCSIGFNCGPGSLAVGHAVMDAVNSKPKPGAQTPKALEAWHGRVLAAFMEWAHPNELTRRRQSEAHLFATGQYTRAEGNPFANS